MDYINNIFTNIKSHNWDKVQNSLENIIKNPDPDLDINMRDNSNNYIINYLVLFNKPDILSLLLKLDAKIDIFDSDNYTILHTPIKFDYLDIVKLLIEHDKHSIGVSLHDLRDDNENIPLHYAIKYSNENIIKYLIKNGSNPNITDKTGNNSLHLAILNRNLNIIKYLLETTNININSRNNNGETALHLACNLQETEIVKYLISNNADVNIKDFEHEFTPLHYVVNIGNKELVEIILSKLKDLNKNLQLNNQDIFGNTPLHYAVMENNQVIFNLLTQFDNINVNLWNIDGRIPLHIFLKAGSNVKKDILDYLIKNSNLNIQDNDGDTCLNLLVKYDIWKNYLEVLSKKTLDIFVKNKNNERIVDLIKPSDKEQFLDLVSNSYLNKLSNKKDTWKDEWENICSKLDIEITPQETKSLRDKNFKVSKTKDITCKNIIKDKLEELIQDSKKCSYKSFPLKKGYICINLDDSTSKTLPICTFTGSTLDILIGLIFLLKKYSNTCSVVTSDFAENNNLCNFYKNNGVIMTSKCEFLNFEIVWAYGKLHLTKDFHQNFSRCLENSSKRFIILPLGIELHAGSHANYLILDKNTMELERFEPHGSSAPHGFNYHPENLDEILNSTFNGINNKIKYISPFNYLPKIGFQLLDIYESKKKKIGDPGGFCALWSIWWADMRIQYNEIPREKLVNYMIETIKQKNISFKNLIRNYAENIIKIRDNILNQSNLDINDWLNDEITKEQVDKVVLNIVKEINSIN